MGNFLQSIIDRDPAAKSKLSLILTYPGVKAVFFHRIANFFSVAKFDLIARIISQFSRFLTGIEIHPGAKIGKNLFIDHGMGVVIGETAIIGDDVTLYHGVTLGGTTWDKGKRHPTLNDGVVVGAGAKILGPFEVGKNARVGSNAVVTKAVPANATVVGIPGRIIERPSEAEQKLRQDLAEKFDAYGMSSDLPDPVAKSLAAILDHMHAVDKKLHCMAAKMKELDASYIDETLPTLNVADFEAAIDSSDEKH